MLAIAIIVFREVLEASLVVGIVLAASRGVARRGVWVAAGISVGVLGAVLVAIGVAGDLFESMLKRSAGVKDSSALIPGHGGVLDRVDALLFAAPVYYVVLKYL